MKLTTRKTATAMQIAQMHESVCTAANVLQACCTKTWPDATAMDIASQVRVLKTVSSLRAAAYSLESEFMSRTSMNAPFADTSNPRRWLDWLDAQAKQPHAGA